MSANLLRNIVLSTLLALAQLNPVPVHEGGPIQLPTGRYKGFHDVDARVSVYYAIPYAHASRFRAPQTVAPSPDREVDASTHGPACINFNIPPPYNEVFEKLLGPVPIHPQQEDCLTLDVYVPDGPQKDLPVLFFSPGGGFLVEASFPYDMRPLVSRSAEMGKPFIAVSINYRLGPLGSLNPSTAKDWNVAILDQFQALRYVNKNIGAFGGDGNKITIMGQSAGAESTLHQLLWSDEQLFRSAWLVSTPSSGAAFLQTTPHDKDALVKTFAGASGCPNNNTIESSVDCLNTLPVEKIAAASDAWEGSSLSLGRVIKENVFRTIRAGKYSKVPVVVSTCRDEGTSFAIGFNASSDEITASGVETLISTAARLSEPEAAKFLHNMLSAYPPDPSLGCPYGGKNTTYGQPSQYKRLAAIFTDSQYTEAWTEYLSTFSTTQKTWGILFDEPIPGPDGAGKQGELGVQHGSDVAFYFPTLLGEQNDSRNNSPTTRKLVGMLQSALVNFVADGDPNGANGNGERVNGEGYQWPEFNSSQQKVTRLTALDGGEAVSVPKRPGFDVIRQALRPEGF